MSDLDLDPIKARAAELTGSEGWYEWITPGSALTRLAYVYESGRVYFPEGDEFDQSDFLLASARDQVRRLITAEMVGDVPALVAEVEWLRAENADLRAGRSHRATEEAQR